MNTKVEPKLKKYTVQYPISTYTFPEDARVHQVRLDDQYIHIELMDERIISVPLWWIPSLYNAEPEEREKYIINQNRTMLIWNPETSEINDELRIMDYLV